MIQCPNCFSWVNDSAAVCPNCDTAMLSPKETAPSFLDQPSIPELGRSVRGMIAGIVAVYLGGFSLLLSCTLTTAAELPLFLSRLAFVLILFIPGLICARIALLNAKHCKAAGNRTRMCRYSNRLGWISLIFGSITLVILITAIIMYCT